MKYQNLFAVIGLSVIGIAQASANFSFQIRPETEYGSWAYNKTAGAINLMKSSFDPSNDRLRFEVNLGKTTQNSLPDGFWLAINNGPNPKGHAGELALFYFDTGATNNNVPKLTVYAYNGHNGNTSYKDGSPASGDQAPDKIASSLVSSSWINQLSYTNEANNTRTMVMDIDATAINNHTPMYPGNTAWTGAQFDNFVGVWFHHVDGLDARYGNDGYLTKYGFEKQGWLDGSNIEAVPEPGSMAVLAAASLIGLRRRRKNS